MKINRTVKYMQGILCLLCIILIPAIMLPGCSKTNGTKKKAKLETGEIKDTSIVIKAGDTGVPSSIMEENGRRTEGIVKYPAQFLSSI